MPIKITVNPLVANALQQAFPSANANRALAKYVACLEKLLFQTLHIGQTPEQRKLKLYSLSMHQLANQGGQIGPHKIRLHKWLADNKLELVQQVIPGSNLNGKLSQVKPSPLVTVEDTLYMDNTLMDNNISDRQIDEMLDATSTQNADLIHLLYPDLQLHADDGEMAKQYELVPIEVQSLKHYIIWLERDSQQMPAAKKATAIRQARMVLAVAQQGDGNFLQRKKPSAFGRIYYHGLSVQSVSKPLRAAMLGNCWEYDIRASALSWKMGFAADYVAACAPGSAVRTLFGATLGYIEDKADFMATVRYSTFRADSACSVDLQKKLIKQAITAIGFGARQTQKGWLDHDGSFQNPALVDIIKNPTERERFFNCRVVRAFLHEQKLLDDFIYRQVKADWPELLNKAIVQTASGRPSKAKVIAYLYQHAETEIMNVVRHVATQYGKTVLARIHDAIIFNTRLGPDLKHEIEWQMRETTGNPYWHLGATELKAWQGSNRDEMQAMDAHRQRIAREEAKAITHTHTHTQFKHFLRRFKRWHPPRQSTNRIQTASTFLRTIRQH